MNAAYAVLTDIVRRFRADMAEAAGIPGEPVPTLAETLATLSRNARTRAANDRGFAAAHCADTGRGSGGSGMSKHTPGPWEVAEEHGDYFVQVAQQPSVCHPMFDRYRIIHGWIGGDRTDNPKAELGTPIANARLIAAAPELLEVAQRSADALRSAGIEPRATSDNPLEWLLHQTEAAIAKATGEQP